MASVEEANQILENGPYLIKDINVRVTTFEEYVLE